MKINPLKYLLPRLIDVVFITLFFGAIILGNQMINADGDLPRHIATGRLILETGKIPVTEPFVFPYLGKPYVAHEWLFGVICYLVYTYIGLTGIVVLSALLIATAFRQLFGYLSSKYNLYMPIFLLIVWGAAATSLHWIARPHLFTMLFLVIWLIWLDRVNDGKKVQLWKFLSLMLLWCNIHAEFIIGILVAFAYLLGWVWQNYFEHDTVLPGIGKQLSIILLSSTLVTFINPAGIQPWLKVTNYLGNNYLMSAINETNSPDFHQTKLLILLGLIILSLVLLFLNTQKTPRVYVILIAALTTLTLFSVRNVHLYGIVIPFTLAHTLIGLKGYAMVNKIESIITGTESHLGKYTGIILIMLSCCILLLFGKTYSIFHFDRSKFPVDATIWLKDHPQRGNVFNDFNWGGYLILNLWPGQRVFIDSMSDHSGMLTQDYANVITLASGWQDILDHYHVEWIIMPRESILGNTLQQDSGWFSLYTDQTASIFVHAP